jgi:hypothetical protein
VGVRGPVRLPPALAHLAGAVHLLTGRDGTFEDVLLVTAWVFLPAMLVSVARPLYFAVAGVSVPAVGIPEAMTAALRETVFAGSTALLAVGTVGLAWQAYVFGGGLQAAKGISRRFGLVVAGSMLAVAALIGSIPREGYIQFVPLLVFGAPLLLFPRTWIRINKNLELIGFRNTREVEPEEWYVWLTRLGGVVLFALVLGAIGGFRYLV